ncbi:hypothetical protein HMPREF9630_00198 [Peptoanaerobacter stomatis]|uniref:NlpC/P60 domain-containing protein n=1 Tax=Peptoanaerobacter stomatis TaxID=796937 RepID=V9HVR9_9FIRM|nr:NlpC/P60 family protein [Peptoanaerobacter stomatis]EHL18473.1 hypothetical protein HMPREF9630_00198 [Peptoanaerobacter stomatis]
MKTRADILKYAESLIGYTNYKLGAKYYNYNNDVNKPKLLDCSGFVVWAYKMAGFNVPDGTYHQWNNSQEVSTKNLKIGDIGIKDKDGLGTYNHIGIYAGNGYWIHCNYSRNGVTLEKTNMFKFYRRFNIMKDVKEDVIPATNNTVSSKSTVKGDDEVVTKGKFNVNGKELEMDRILKEGHNYIKVKDLEKAGFKINYIQETKTVKIDSN